MSRIIRCFCVLMACGLIVAPQGVALATEDGIVGVIGFDPVESQSCIAVWVPLAEDEALAGVRWFNNDGTVAFAELYLSGGEVSTPGLLGDAVGVSEMVQGGSSVWSQVIFTEDYISDAEGLYVIFRLPYGSVQVAEGEGGGAGIGYKSDGTGVAGWLTLEGSEWDPLHPAFGFAVEAIVGERDVWSVVLEQSTKSLGLPDDQEDLGVVELRTALLPPQPNPFNPQTTLRFMLKDAGRVEFGIYDLQGHLVKQLAGQMYSAGEHTLTWYGRNDQGREMASGVYLAKLTAGRYSQTHRLVLVR